MDNLLIKYMNDRVDKNSSTSDPGPVITLSRQYGCYASQIAFRLAKKINDWTLTEDWEWISKEVLEDAAKQLKMKPEEIAHIFGAEEKSFIRDIIESFSFDKYTSDTKIKRTVAQIVKTYAYKGKAVIVGRAGCIVAKPIKKSLHVRLIAPFEWRVQQTMTRFNISKLDAENRVIEQDGKRDTFMKFFRGDKPDNEIFDIIYNRKTMHED